MTAGTFILAAPSVETLSVDPMEAAPVAEPRNPAMWNAATLAARVRAGDETAFTEMHRQYAPRLQRYALVESLKDETFAFIQWPDGREQLLIRR